MEKAKRDRSANWTEQEKDKFLEIVRIHIAELEDKKTDGNANKRKEMAWTKVQTEFAVEHGLKEKRRLKELWRRIKDSAKKDVARYTKETKKTGGGQAPKELSDNTLLIKDLIPGEFTQMYNPFDDDGRGISGKETDGDVDNSEEGENTNIDIPVQENIESSNDDHINDDDDGEDVIIKPFSQTPLAPTASTPATQTKNRFPSKRRLQSPVDIPGKKQKTSPIIDVETKILQHSEEEHKYKIDILKKKNCLLNLKTKLAEAKLNRLKPCQKCQHSIVDSNEESSQHSIVLDSSKESSQHSIILDLSKEPSHHSVIPESSKGSEVDRAFSFLELLQDKD